MASKRTRTTESVRQVCELAIGNNRAGSFAGVRAVLPEGRRVIGNVEGLASLGPDLPVPRS
jgi:hypothetical protein